MRCAVQLPVSIRVFTDHNAPGCAQDKCMQAPRHLELLEAQELNRLMELALEAACFARGFGKRLVAAYHALAAECAFELWCRDHGYRF